MRLALALAASTALALAASPALAQGRGAADARACDLPVASWLVAGPFVAAPGASLDAHDAGDPTTLTPRAGQRAGSGAVLWQSAVVNTAGRLNLGPVFPGSMLDNAVVFAHTYIASPSARTVRIGIEGNGALTLWVNGSVAYRRATPPARGTPTDTVTLALAAGVNRVLYRLVNRVGAPTMSARLLSSSPDPIADIFVSETADVTAPAATAPSRMRLGPVTVGTSLQLTSQGGRSALLFPYSLCASRSSSGSRASFAGGQAEGGTRVTLTGGPVALRMSWTIAAQNVLAGGATVNATLIPDTGSFVSPTSLRLIPADMRASATIPVSASALLDMLSRPIDVTVWQQAAATPTTRPTGRGDVVLPPDAARLRSEWAPLNTTPADSMQRRALAAIGFAIRVPIELTGLTLHAYAGEFLPQGRFMVNGRSATADSLGRVTLCSPCTWTDVQFEIQLNGARWWDPPVIRVADLGWREIRDGGTWGQFFTRDNTIPIPGDTVATQLLSAVLLPDKAPYKAIIEQWLTRLGPPISMARRDTIDIVGNSHIDAAWMWRWPETQEVVDATWASATKLMAKYPDMHFAASAAQYYEWVEQRQPDLLARIKQLEKEGRWDLVGGWWLEPDVYLPSGESLVRQALIGQRSFIRMFGHPVRVAWIPDSFGYPASLPQILLKSGTDFFVTQKVRWNTTNRWPATLNQFWWEGLDGSRIFTYIPYGYDHALVPQQLATQKRSTIDSSAVDNMLTLYGVGDHGGGPTMQMLERSHDLKRIPTFPVIRDVSPLDALSRMRAAMPPNAPVVKDELYPEYHRGVWVSQAEMKMWNRRMEGSLQAAEAAATVASAPYPRVALEQAWKKTLFNQFHDLLPGSGITPIYADAMVDYHAADSLVEGALIGAVRSLVSSLDTRPIRAGDIPIAVFNPSAVVRGDIVTVTTVQPPAGRQWQAVDGTGRPLRTEQIADGGVRVRVESVPAFGASIVFLRSSPSEGLIRRAPNPLILENAYLRVEIDSGTGGIARMFDKVRNRDVLARTPASGGLVLRYDNPTRQDAWEIDNLTGARTWLLAAARPVVVRDSMGPSILVTRGRDSAVVRQRYFLRDSAQRLDVETTVDWHQAHHLLDVAFPLAFHIDSTYAETPYAVIARPTRPANKVDSARFIAPTQRFVDGSSRDYGVAIVSDGKYGYSASGDTIFLSLLRAPKSPDPVADMGIHKFTYSIVPHAGDWRAPAVREAAVSLNSPLRGVAVDAHAGIGRSTPSVMTITGGTVELGALKRAEDSEAWVVRIVETSGRATTASLRFASAPGTVSETDLLERPTGKTFTPSGTVLSVPLGPWEIKTLLVPVRR